MGVCSHFPYRTLNWTIFGSPSYTSAMFLVIPKKQYGVCQSLGQLEKAISWKKGAQRACLWRTWSYWISHLIHRYKFSHYCILRSLSMTCHSVSPLFLKCNFIICFFNHLLLWWDVKHCQSVAHTSNNWYIVLVKYKYNSHTQ